MRVGFIGAGIMATTFGRHLISAGHEIVISNSRGPDTLAQLVADLGPNASAGTKHDAADCEIVVLGTFWVDVPTALEGIKWNGQILIDATNAHMDAEPDVSLAGVTKSMAKLGDRISTKMVADMAPGARIVKAISNIPMAWIQDFSPQKPKTVIFVSGDDAEAKKQVADLIDGLGFAAIDLGSLDTSAAVVQVGGPLSGFHFHYVQRMR